MANNCKYDNQHIQYCEIDGEWYVGDNESKAYSNFTPSKIVIPETIENGQNIKFIGACAFTQNYVLTFVKINARIEAIHSHGFANCPNLQYINIPSTLKIIYSNGIQCWEFSQLGSLRKGTLIVAFEYDSQLQEISDQVFSFKEFLNIYICNEINPKINGEIFKMTTVRIYSTNKFSFNGIPATLSYTCSPSYIICTPSVKHQTFNICISKYFIICFLFS